MITHFSSAVSFAASQFLKALPWTLGISTLALSTSLPNWRTNRAVLKIANAALPGAAASACCAAIPILTGRFSFLNSIYVKGTVSLVFTLYLAYLFKPAKPLPIKKTVPQGLGQPTPLEIIKFDPAPQDSVLLRLQQQKLKLVPYDRLWQHAMDGQGFAVLSWQPLLNNGNGVLHVCIEINADSKKPYFNTIRALYDPSCETFCFSEGPRPKVAWKKVDIKLSELRVKLTDLGFPP